jgi:hypothetical protein
LLLPQGLLSVSIPDAPSGLAQLVTDLLGLSRVLHCRYLRSNEIYIDKLHRYNRAPSLRRARGDRDSMIPYVEGAEDGTDELSASEKEV